jgi:hypothetical protein
MRNVLQERPGKPGVPMTTPPSPPWPANPPSGITPHILAALVGVLVAAVALGAIAAVCMRRSYPRLSSPRQSSGSAVTRRGFLLFGGASANSSASTATSTGKAPNRNGPQMLLADMAVCAASSEAHVVPTAGHAETHETHQVGPSSGSSAESGNASSTAKPFSSQAGNSMAADWSGDTALGDSSLPLERVEAWQAGIRLRHATKQRGCITVFEGAAY